MVGELRTKYIMWAGNITKNNMLIEIEPWLPREVTRNIWHWFYFKRKTKKKNVNFIFIVKGGNFYRTIVFLLLINRKWTEQPPS